VTSEGSVSLAAKDAVDMRLSILHLTGSRRFKWLLIFGEDIAPSVILWHIANTAAIDSAD